VAEERCRAACMEAVDRLRRRRSDVVVFERESMLQKQFRCRMSSVGKGYLVDQAHLSHAAVRW
jgi:hypothetical protein